MNNEDPYANLEESILATGPKTEALDQQLFKDRKQRDQTAKRRNGEMATPPVQPKTKRQGMDFYETDLLQLAKLQLSIKEKSGKKPTVRELLHEALEDFFKKKSL